MKRITRTILEIALLGAVAASLIGCGTTPQTTALNTLSTLEQSTTAAYDGYLALVVKGTVPTNDVPKISHLFNTFQADMIVAIVSVNGNSNAIAPASIIAEAASFSSQVSVSQSAIKSP
jgi:hypothetical protein